MGRVYLALETKRTSLDERIFALVYSKYKEGY